MSSFIIKVRFSAYFAEGKEAVAKLANSTAVAEDSEGGEQNSSSMNDMSMSMDEYQLPSSMPQAFQATCARIYSMNSISLEEP